MPIEDRQMKRNAIITFSTVVYGIALTNLLGLYIKSSYMLPIYFCGFLLYTSIIALFVYNQIYVISQETPLSYFFDGILMFSFYIFPVTTKYVTGRVNDEGVLSKIPPFYLYIHGGILLIFLFFWMVSILKNNPDNFSDNKVLKTAPIIIIVIGFILVIGSLVSAGFVGKKIF